MSVEKSVDVHEPSGPVVPQHKLVEADKPDGVVIPLVSEAGLSAYPELGRYGGHPCFGVEDVKMARDLGRDGIQGTDHWQRVWQIGPVTCQVDDGFSTMSLVVKINGREADRRVYAVKAGVECWIKTDAAGNVTLLIEYPK